MIDESEAYFESLKCVECRRKYWTDQELKMCKRCASIHRSNEKVAKMHNMMMEKNKPDSDRSKQFSQMFKDRKLV